MPKLKTHKGAASRFHITGSGKVMRMKRHRSHLRRTKHGNVKRQLRTKQDVAAVDTERITKLLPYGKP
ncbi:MAG: 50S ribosomal protein L35 [SAR202 cluster bacterium]|nr:50S ribosomal protein L35 [SAR202 cluster bacterium]